MLKWRIITAAILAPLFLAAIWLLPSTALALLFAAMVALGGWEWARIIRLGTAASIAYVGVLLALLLLGWLYLGATVALLPLVLAGLWWVAATLWVLNYNREGGGPLAVAPALVVGYCVLWPAWFGLVYLHAGTAAGPFWITFLLLLVWGADIGAYFAGRAFGRNKLAPRVSPGKTWEGVLGGVALAVLAGWLFYAAVRPEGPPLVWLLPLALVVVAISVVGDLFESMLKRRYGVKDSGTILPGHGGVLDRVDSITAAAPVFALGILLWQLWL